MGRFGKRGHSSNAAVSAHHATTCGKPLLVNAVTGSANPPSRSSHPRRACPMTSRCVSRVGATRRSAKTALASAVAAGSAGPEGAGFVGHSGVTGSEDSTTLGSVSRPRLPGQRRREGIAPPSNPRYRLEKLCRSVLVTAPRAADTGPGLGGAPCRAGTEFAPSRQRLRAGMTVPSAAQLDEPTTPSASKPASPWNARTAASVASSNDPESGTSG